MSNRTEPCRLARFETLERKCMLAGDVLVSVVNGHVNVEGDAESNQVAITAGTEANAFVITGLEGTNLHLVDPDTDVPGPAVGSLTVTDVHRVNVELGDADDELAVFDAQLHGKVNIDTGDGNDQVMIGAEATAGEELNGLLTEDANVAIVGHLKIDTGLGDDEISVGNAAIYGKLRIEAGDGEDIVSLGGEEGAAPALVGGLDTSDLPDPVLTVRGHLNVDLGEDDDQLMMAQVRVRGSADIDAALGDDDLDFSLSAINHLKLDAGDGADDVDLSDSVFAALSVKLGDGDDLLATANLRAKLAFVAGGDGEDTLDELVESDIVRQIVRGVEVPEGISDLPVFRRFCAFPFFGRNGFGRLFR